MPIDVACAEGLLLVDGACVAIVLLVAWVDRRLSRRRPAALPPPAPKLATSPYRMPAPEQRPPRELPGPPNSHSR
jgi:hypothetical protein